MKITCACGALLSDNTDFMPHKAHLVADQDYFDYLDAGREQRQYQRAMYQCRECGRLLLQNRAGDLHRYTFFSPDDREAARDALRSNLGHRWRGFLYGQWRTNGDVWWSVGDGESGAEEFDTWDRLERRYHQLFAALRGRGVLRKAMLTRDGETIHAYEEP